MHTYVTTKQLKQKAFTINSQNTNQENAIVGTVFIKMWPFFSKLCAHFELVLWSECTYVLMTEELIKKGFTLKTTKMKGSIGISATFTLEIRLQKHIFLVKYDHFSATNMSFLNRYQKSFSEIRHWLDNLGRFSDIMSNSLKLSKYCKL